MSIIKFVIEGGDQQGVGGQLVLSEDVLMYAPFRQLYEADPHPQKVHAFADLKWVRLMAEEVGAFDHLEGTDKIVAVNHECYAKGVVVLEKEREALRSAAYNFFIEAEETVEGQTISMIDRRINVIRKIIIATEKDPASIKDDKQLEAYMASSNTQTTALLTLVNNKEKVKDNISKNGGRKKVRNVAGAVTSPNEAGTFSLENIERRRAQREELENKKVPANISYPTQAASPLYDF